MLLAILLDASTEDLGKASYLCPVAGGPVEYHYHSKAIMQVNTNVPSSSYTPNSQHSGEKLS